MAPPPGIRIAAGVITARVTTAGVTTAGGLATRAAAAGNGDGDERPVPLLFLISDTGGGHRSAAVAVRQALDRAYPGRFAVTLHDPLAGPDAAPLLRWVTRLYGPLTRRAPWLWGAAYYLTNSRTAVALLDATLLRLADKPVARAVTACRPAAIVSFHPLTGPAAVRAGRDRQTRTHDLAGLHNVTAGSDRPGAADHAGGPGVAAACPAGALPVVTIVTDLGAAHAAWRHVAADLTIVPPGQAVHGRDRQAERGGRPPGGRSPAGHGGRVVRAGPPAGREFWAGPATAAERMTLRRELGLSQDRLLVVLAGGGEGCGGIGRRAAALLRGLAEVQVVAVCGRNDRLRRRLQRRAARADGRLVVTGYTRRLPDLMRCADLVVTKAGPGTITEATCCGAPLLLTAQLPGQERGNASLVVGSRAGRRVPGVRALVAEVARLQADRTALASLSAASARLGRPGDTHGIAALIAALADRGPVTGAGLATSAGSATPAGATARVRPVTGAGLATSAGSATPAGATRAGATTEAGPADAGGGDPAAVAGDVPDGRTAGERAALAGSGTGRRRG
ncbi:MAG TPA: glycosyltransferase [Streptosporangiaceae bacterium]